MTSSLHAKAEGNFMIETQSLKWRVVSVMFAVAALTFGVLVGAYELLF